MLSVDSLVENSPLVVRFASAGAGALIFVAGLLNLFFGPSYPVCEVGLLGAAAGATCVMSELSPFGLHHLLKIFPFLANQLGRGVLYLCCGALMLSSHFGHFAVVASALLIVAGASNIAMFVYGPRNIGLADSQQPGPEFDNYAPI